MGRQGVTECVVLLLLLLLLFLLLLSTDRCCCCCLCFWFLLDATKGNFTGNDSASTFSPCSGSAPSWPPLTRRGFPPAIFVDFVFFGFFLGLVAFCFFLLGWWGSPCRVFLLPPFSWFWVVGLGISACSCFLHLSLSLASRVTWSSDPQPPRPPQPLVLGRACFTHLLLSSAGSRRWDAPRQRAVG